MSKVIPKKKSFQQESLKNIICAYGSVCLYVIHFMKALVIYKKCSLTREKFFFFARSTFRDHKTLAPNFFFFCTNKQALIQKQKMCYDKKISV